MLSLTACSVSDLPFIYRPDRQQGTVLQKERVERLEQGMSRRQVRFLIGTPDIEDPFHPNRWDYVYSLDPSDGGEIQKKRLTLYFDGDRLIGARGSFIDPDSPIGQGTPAAGK